MDYLKGDEWEELCEECLQEKFKAEVFIPITANTHGDWGIDGYVKTGIVIQCYNPDEENLSPSSLDKKLKVKINTDLKKLKTYQNDLRNLLNGTKIKRWVLLTCKILDKDIHLYANKKADEYRKENLDILDENFNVEVQPFSFISAYVNTTRFKINYQNNEVIGYNEDLEKSLESNYLENLNRKLMVLCKNNSDEVKSLKKIHIIKYCRGMEVCKKFEEDYPKKYKIFLDAIKSFELNIEEELILLKDGDRSDKTIFGIIKEKLEKNLKNNFSSELDNNFLDKLRDYYVSLWLLQCPIDFKEEV